MILVIPFCAKDRELAVKLRDWITEIGPYPTHHLLVVRDSRAQPIDFAQTGFVSVKEIVVRDPADKWPDSSNALFRAAAKQIQYSERAPWLWCEPDAVPIRAGWLDDIAAEYATARNAGRFFLGDLQDKTNNTVANQPGFVPHSSGLAVYPPEMTEHAGEVFFAQGVPFDVAGGPQIVPRLQQSELLFHVWNRDGKGLAPFTSWQDFEQKVLSRRPKCAIFHADKGNSLIPILRARRDNSAVEGYSLNAAADAGSTPAPCPPAENNLPVPVLADTTPVGQTPSCKSEVESEARESTGRPSQIKDGSNPSNSRGGQFIYEHPDIADCNKIWIKVDAEGRYIDTFEFKNGEWVPVQWLQIPWQDRASSIAEIQSLCARLKQFQTDMAKIRLVREELHNAGVIKLAYRFKKRKGWKKKG